MSRLVLAVLRGALIGYVLVLFGLYLGRDALVYQDVVVSRSRIAAEAAALQLEPLFDKDNHFRGLIGHPKRSPDKGTIVLFHSRSGSVLERAGYADIFQSRGFRIVYAEYPGYGPQAEPMNEAAFARSATDLLEQVAQRWPGRLSVIGVEMGASVAAQAAAVAQAKIDRLVLVSPWLDLPDVAAEQSRWLPTGLLVTDRFQTLPHVQQFAGQVDIVLLGDDPRVGPHHGEALYRGLRDKQKGLWYLPRASLADWTVWLAPRQWDYLLEPPGFAEELALQKAPQRGQVSESPPAAPSIPARQSVRSIVLE